MMSILGRLQKLEGETSKKFLFGLAFVDKEEGGTYISRARASSRGFKKTLEITLTAQTEDDALRKTSAWFDMHIDPQHGKAITYYGEYDLED